MVGSLINGFLNMIFSIVSWFTNLITTPFFKFINEAFPDLSAYNIQFNDFLTNYVFRGVAFARELFLNFTGMPREIYYVWILFLFAIFALWLGTTGLTFLINMFRMWKRGL